MGERSGRIPTRDEGVDADEEARDGDVAAGVRREVTGCASNFLRFSAILIGGAIAGACDITYAITFWAFRGVSATRVLAVGREWTAWRAGIQWRTLEQLLLGLVLHFFIAFSAATIFYFAAKTIPILVRRAVSLRHPLRTRHLCDHESGRPAAFRFSTQGYVSAARYDDRDLRAHVSHRFADLARSSPSTTGESLIAHWRTELDARNDGEAHLYSSAPTCHSERSEAKSRNLSTSLDERRADSKRCLDFARHDRSTQREIMARQATVA